MKKAILSFLTIWVLVCANLVGLILISPEENIPVSADTIIVDDDGTPGVDCNYTIIQWAIDNASVGDTIFVKNGTYYENVVVNKTINLTGEDRDNTIIDGTGVGYVVSITVDWVNITGFLVTNSGNNSHPTPNIRLAGIYLESVENCKMINNNVSNNNEHGIKLNYSNNNFIANNIVISNNFRGIALYYSNNNILYNNSIKYHDVHSGLFSGIYVGGGSSNLISNNYLFSNYNGIYLGGTQENRIENNTLDSHISNGLQLYSFANDNTIQNNTLIFNGIGIFIRTSSAHNTINNNNISNNIRRGIYMVGSDYNEFYNNTMFENSFYILGDQLEHWNTHTISLNNTINSKPVYYWKNATGGIVPSGTGQIILANSSNVIVKNQNLSNGTSGILLGFSNSNLIENNTCLNSTDDGLLISYWSNNNKIRNNTFSYGLRGIRLYHFSNNNTFDNNSFDSNDDTGLYFISYCDYNKILNNTGNDHYSQGLFLLNSNHNYIWRNQFFNNGYYGIIIQESENNTIKENNCSDNGFGISSLYSNGNIINNNTISSNNIEGIHFINSTRNTIIGNHISNNPEGIYLDNSSENVIYHNNLIDNTVQAYDNMHNNTWNDSYPSGGNYWSDYGGVDNFQGPNQDLPGSDGIGDTNYSIDSDSIDHYPLIEPAPRNYLYLYPGWNLISLPLIQENTSLLAILQSITGEYDAVQWYNSSDLNDPWKHYQTSKLGNLNDLDKLDHLIGFWIHITNPNGIYFRYLGAKIAQGQTITLQPGWNMVGYPALTNYNRTQGLNNLTFDSEIDAIWTFNTQNQRWKQMEETDTFEPGRGYWIHATTECEWEVPL